MLSVWVAFDGKQKTEDVAWQTGMSLADLWTIIIKLAKLKLIAQVVKKVDIVDDDFINYLVSVLWVSLGSLGEIVVEDGLEDLGYSRNNLSQKRCAELVNF